VTTSPTVPSSVFREPLGRGDLVYHRQRLRNRIYECVYKAVLRRHERDGITRTDLAARLGKDRAQISRWLSGPSNWTIDTVSDLLLALDVELELSTCLIEEMPIANYTHPLMVESEELSGEVWMAASGGVHFTRLPLPPRQQAGSTLNKPNVPGRLASN
jgi:hypothetical protein